MNRVSIGKIAIQMSSLKKMFNLPEEITIVNPKIEYGMLEFQVYSSEPIKGVTILSENELEFNNIRRIRVPLEESE